MNRVQKEKMNLSLPTVPSQIKSSEFDPHQTEEVVQRQVGGEYSEKIRHFKVH